MPGIEPQSKRNGTQHHIMAGCGKRAMPMHPSVPGTNGSHELVFGALEMCLFQYTIQLRTMSQVARPRKAAASARRI